MSYRRLLNFSRNCATWSINQRPTAISTKFYKDFKEYYPNLVDRTIANCKDLDHALLESYCKRIAEYFTVCKLPIQGEFMVYAYELLEEPENLTNEKLHQVYTLGCVMEAIQGFWIIGDDKIDNCKTRAGKATWHLLPDTSNKIINDLQWIKSFVNDILRQNIHKSYFPQIMDVVNEMYLETDMGQFLDSIFPTTKDFGKYTRDNYNRISYSKAACYSFNSPMLLALILSNKASEESFRNVRHLCTDLGSFIQINNDFTEYLEYDESKPLKPSSDFANGTCTWTSVTALENCNEEQKRIFKECYGSSDPKKIKRVVKIFDDIDMKKLYKQEEANRYDTYLQKVHKLPVDSVPSREVFLKILEFFQGYLAQTTRFYYVSH